MDRTQKQALVETLQNDLGGAVCIVVTHQTGLSVAEATQLRRQMRDAGAGYRVTKNRLAKRALEGTEFASLAPLFTGPTAVAFSRDPVAAAKAAVAFANRNDKLTIVGGGLAGQALDVAGVRALATLPSLAQRSVAHEASFDEIIGRLRRSLAGSAAVFTHNPWGEYGHEEHSLVYAAVNALQPELGFELYVSPYVGSAVLNLFRQVVDGGINGVARFAVDRRAVSDIADLYRQHGAWTWTETWDWPPEESFFQFGAEGRIRTRSLPFEFIDVPPH